MTEDKESISENNKNVQWTTWIIITINIAILLFGGGFLYTNVINRPILSYKILPNYNLEEQFFTGVVIENQGKKPITNITISIANLDSSINLITLPGLHEKVEVVSGGTGENNISLEMPRLSTGKSLSLYLLSSAPINLSDDTLLISSSEIDGQPSGEQRTIWSSISMILGILYILNLGFVVWNVVTLSITIKDRKKAEFDAMKDLIKIASKIYELEDILQTTSTDSDDLSSEQAEIRNVIEGVSANAKNI